MDIKLICSLLETGGFKIKKTESDHILATKGVRYYVVITESHAGILRYAWRVVFLISKLYWEYLQKYPKEVLNIVLPINDWDEFDFDEASALRGLESAGMLRVKILDNPKVKHYGANLQHMG